jgi:hypothetical protein
MSNLTGVPMELLYASQLAGTAKASFTTEVAINDTAGMGGMPILPANFFANNRAGRALRVVARGIISSTASPTFTFSTRLGATGSPSTAPIVLGTAALTGANTTNSIWEYEGDIVVQAPAAAGNNTVCRGIGLLTSAGFTVANSPIWGGAASPGTVSFDSTIANTLSFDVACSVSAAGNTIQLLQLLVYGQN